MARRRGLIASGIAMVALFLAMSPAENRMTDTGGPGMVPFELSGGQHRADEILAEWGEDGQDAAREQLWIDFGFMLAYGSLLTFALAAVLDLARKRGWRRFAAVGGVVALFGALGASCDALENICLLLILGGAGAAFPLLATSFATCKFILLALAIVYLIAGIGMRLLWRPIERTS
jgi:nitrate/nitrite transporter NarK